MYLHIIDHLAEDGRLHEIAAIAELPSTFVQVAICCCIPTPPRPVLYLLLTYKKPPQLWNFEHLPELLLRNFEFFLLQNFDFFLEFLDIFEDVNCGDINHHINHLSEV